MQNLYEKVCNAMHVQMSSGQRPTAPLPMEKPPWRCICNADRPKLDFLRVCLVLSMIPLAVSFHMGGRGEIDTYYHWGCSRGRRPLAKNVCIQACTCVLYALHVRVSCMYECIHVVTYVMHVCMYICMHIYICTYVCVYAMCDCMYVRNACM